MDGAPTDGELLEALRPAFSAPITRLHRRPFRYASSAPLEELTLVLGDGTRSQVIFKDADPARMLPEASRHKPRFMLDPRRAIELQRRVLDPDGLGPTCHVAELDLSRRRYWLIYQKVNGPVLWQVGDPSVWMEAARWLARFHSRFATPADARKELSSVLLDVDANWFRLWAARAAGVLASRADRPAQVLLDRLAGYESVVQSLAALPRTLIHGEFYPSNVLVDLEGAALEERILPIDWETAGWGPGLLDLAALTSGWPTRERTAFVNAYLAEADQHGAGAISEDVLVDLERCCLHQSLMWIGWSAGRVAPDGHAHDWVSLALHLASALV